MDIIVRSIDMDLAQEMSREAAVGLLLEGLVGLEVMVPLLRKRAEEEVQAAGFFRRAKFWFGWGDPYRKVWEAEQTWTEFARLLDVVRASNAKLVNVESDVITKAHSWFNESKQFKRARGYRRNGV